MARGRGLIRQRGNESRRRRSGWSLGPGGEARTALSLSGVQLIGGGVVPTSDGITLVRIRGLFDWYLTLGTSPNDGFFGAVGIGLVEAAAFAAGIGSVPTPITEISSENWLWHQFFSMHAPVASASPDSNGPSMSGRVEIDSKAMRKVNSAQVVYAAVEVVEIGTATGSIFFDTRMLSLLP